MSEMKVVISSKLIAHDHMMFKMELLMLEKRNLNNFSSQI
jgi:hypothetical protein